MTLQDDTARYLPTSDNDAIPFPATPAVATRESRTHTLQENNAQHRDLTAWHTSDDDRAQRHRADVLPILPQGPSRLQRRWHLAPDEATPINTPAHMAQPQPGIPATLQQHSLQETQPAPHAAQTATLSLATQMMAQESPITEQGPPQQR